MRRILLGLAVAGAMAVGGVLGGSAAQAGPPVHYVDWDHHHHGHTDHYYEPYRVPQYQARYYSPAVVYPPIYPPACEAPAPVYYQPAPVTTYYPYPGNYVSLFGRNFGIRVGF